MYNYSEQIEAFRGEKVRMSSELKQKLYDHRDANRNRLKGRLPGRINGLRVSDASFRPQGSMAVDTIIQSKFKYEEYDIDDGLVLQREDLVTENDIELTSNQVRNHVLQALKDDRFFKQPNLCSNAIRVFYKEEDEERHHIDIPVYRIYVDDKGNSIRELAGENGWLESDPTQVNNWFNDRVADLNKSIDGKGTQFRQLVQLLKRFCRSRDDWDMPSGMKITMLVAECQPLYNERIDVVFRYLLETIGNRLKRNKVICNLAHPDRPALTRTYSDPNVEELASKIEEALRCLNELDKSENNTEKSARDAWEWIFRSDGYFREYDKDKRLSTRIDLINSGCARTNSFGVISAIGGIANTSHRFYGE